MKNITWRPKEKRYIGRKQVNGMTYTVYAKTQLACMKKLNTLIKQVKEENNTIVKQKHSFTFEEYWNKWYKENKYPFIADSTRDEFEILKRKCKPLYNLKLNKITKENLLTFFESLDKNRTKEKVIVQLKSLFTNAVKESVIKNNPFNTIVFKLTKRTPKKAFSYEQQQKILNELRNEEIYPIILFYLITGLRKNELDFKNIENCIDKEKNLLTTINLKSRNREVRYKKIKLTKDAVNLVLCNLNIFHKYNERSLSDAFSSFLKKNNIEGSLVNCRHTFATNSFYLGKDSLIISREMGHTTSQITKDNYIDVDYNLSKEKILKLYNNLYNLS